MERKRASERARELEQEKERDRETEYGLFYRALLQKRPIILRSLLIVATQHQRARAREREESRAHHIQKLEEAYKLGGYD